MTYLGEQEAGRLCSIQEISRAADVPMPYLAKIINRLATPEPTSLRLQQTQIVQKAAV